MIFEEHISAFLDGALSAAEETEFLHILSVSPEKRELFHAHLGVKSALAADARSSAVPSKLDAAVFAAAGGAAAGGAAAGGAAAGGAAAGGAAAGGAAAGGLAAGGSTAVSSAAASSAAVSSAGASVVAAAGWWTGMRIVSAVLLGLSLFGAGYFLHDRLSGNEETASETAIMQNMHKESPGNMQNVHNDAAQNMQNVHNGADADSRIDGGEGRAAQGNGQQGSSASAQRVVYRNVYVTRVDTVYLTDADRDRSPQIVERIDTVSIALMHSAPEQRPIQINQAPLRSAELPLPGHLELEVQREHLTTFPYIDYNRLGVDRNQQRFAASAAWIFNEHHAAGVTVGQKPFAMDYYNLNSDTLYLYQDQPVLLYGGAFYRFSLPAFTGVTPEFTMMLGGAEFGPVIGGRLAVQLSPTQHFSIIVGANGTLLAYRFKDKVFTSQNLGLSYGIRYRF
ncbi:hypothetical protein KQI65_02335 [bacterium]|nr:hypothetical protein [bacterium]